MIHRREVTECQENQRKRCKHPGCPKLTDGNYCEEHEALHRGERESAGKRGYNKKWQKARARYLKEHPLCVECLKNGRVVTATVVDHITPHRGNPILFWDEGTGRAYASRAMIRKHGTRTPIPCTISDEGGGLQILHRAVYGRPMAPFA